MAKNGLQFDLSYEKYNHQEIMHSNVQEAIIVKSFFYRYVKRFIDIVIATLGLISLLPLILIGHAVWRTVVDRRQAVRSWSALAATGLSGIAHLWRAPSWAEIEAVEKAKAVPREE